MSPEEVVNEFIVRITALDLERACELVSDDVEYDNVPMGKVHGPEGIKNLLAQMAGAIDDMEWVVHRQTVTGRTVMNERTDRFAKDGKWVDLPVAGVFEIDDNERITLWRDYFDLATMTTALTELSQ